jgi:predicted nucleotidyltransferase
MIPLIERNRAAVEQLCHRYHVARLDVFGSAATGGFNPDSSDLDFLVEFQRTDEMTLADQYFGLWEGLRDLFDRDVDLLTPRSLRNPYFTASVERSREELYAA